MTRYPSSTSPHSEGGTETNTVADWSTTSAPGRLTRANSLSRVSKTTSRRSPLWSQFQGKAVCPSDDEIFWKGRSSLYK